MSSFRLRTNSASASFRPCVDFVLNSRRAGGSSRSLPVRPTRRSERGGGEFLSVDIIGLSAGMTAGTIQLLGAWDACQCRANIMWHDLLLLLPASE